MGLSVIFWLSFVFFRSDDFSVFLSSTGFLVTFGVSDDFNAGATGSEDWDTDLTGSGDFEEVFAGSADFEIGFAGSSDFKAGFAVSGIFLSSD